ncbi:hypothetical protein N9064_01325 [bacterium]|nr:hypothetical protein [bacterium]
MKKCAILISGHLRNLHEIIENFYDNLIVPIAEQFSYDIYIHTWDNNHTMDKIMNYDKHFVDIKITEEYINKLFNDNDIFIKKIIIENQEEIKNKLNLKDYLNNNTEKRTIHNKFKSDYVKDIVNKLFFQFYGHYMLLNCVDLNCNYDFIIKTRPDMFYEKFDINLFNYDIFFPNSHKINNSNINQLFFGGKTEYMINILKFFENIIFYDKNINFNIVNKYHKTDINFNCLFRYYILNYLNYRPFFTKYNPKIYRNKEIMKIIS